PGGAVELVADVVVDVVDEQVRVAAVIDAGLRAVLVVAFDHDVGRQRHGLHVALAGIGVDDDVDLGGGVTVDDVVGDAVQVVAVLVVLAEIGVEPAVAVGGGDVVNDGRGVGGDRGVGDLLVPRVVGREELLA